MSQVERSLHIGVDVQDVVHEVNIEVKGAVGVSILSSVGTGGARSGAFAAIISGHCGATRDLEWYENPFSTDLVLLGNICFIFLVMSVMALCGYVYERRIPRMYEMSGMALKYKGVEVGFMLLLYFIAPVLVSFVKFRRKWYEMLSTFLGLCLCFFSVAVLRRETLLMKVDVIDRSVKERCSRCLPGEWFHCLTDDSHEWSGGAELLGPLVGGYTSKVALWLDLRMIFVISCSTLSEDCASLGYITVAMNLLYCVYILWKAPLQPLSIGYSNISSMLGQSIGILLVIAGVKGTPVAITVYLASVVSLILMMLPVVRFIIDKRSSKERPADKGILLELLTVSSTDVEL
jgi:hypothetical protein